MRTNALLGCLALTMSAAPAFANFYVPSFVQMVAQPLFWSPAVFTCVVTVPVLLAIAAIESAVIRWALPEKPRMRAILWHLLWVNALTSLAGFFMPNGTEVVPGIFVAYAITVPVEALILAEVLRSRTSLRGYHRWLWVSARANAVSYAVLGAALIAMSVLPDRGIEDTAVRAGCRGTILVLRLGSSVHVVELDASTTRVHTRDIAGLTRSYRSAGPLVTQAEGDPSGLWTMGREGPRRVPARWRIPGGSLAAVDAELRLALVCEDGSWSVRNVRSGAVKAAAKLPVGAALNDGLLTFDGAYAWGALGPKRASALDERRQVVDLATGRVRDIASGDSIASSPTAAEIAWTTRGGIVVFHCPTGTSRRIEASGAGGWGLAWSPDGTMLAYTGSTNPFTSQPWFTDLRVVEPRTGRSTTVARRLFTAGAGARLFWVR